jgi:hypothetical protein
MTMDLVGHGSIVVVVEVDTISPDPTERPKMQTRSYRLGKLHFELTRTNTYWSQSEKNGASRHHVSLATIFLDNGIVLRRFIWGRYRIIWTWNNG